MDIENKILNHVLTERTGFIKLVLGAIILSFSSGLLANYVTELLRADYFYLLVISTLLIFLTLFYFAFLILQNTKKTIEFETVVIVDEGSKKLNVFRDTASRKSYPILYKQYLLKMQL
ncbi:hypothetical protein [Leptospira stimsonii]|uniref:Uncharacterized protein n=1 Tax=Leptospira stimsonii TaxID=2202203 RepID=A0A8B3CYD7_9LEPT|nr:hypothetical protein [Leptospira stimsonii]RHX88720.1 hypothetical protein DLM78_07310 [Leptospira stimsonii]